MATKTIEHGGATYVVRALTTDEQQTAINIAIDLLWLIAQQRGWKIKPEDKGKGGSYPYSVYAEARTYINLYLATVVEGAPAHTMPKGILDAIDPKVFEQWSKDLHPLNEFKQHWIQAFDEANKTETDPQAPSGVVPPAVNSDNTTAAAL